MRIALFGGSFHPPHVGHLLAAVYVRAVAPVDEVWLMPADRHAFGKELAPFDDRVALCEAMATLVPGGRVSRVEQEVGAGGRTLPVVEALVRRHPEHTFRLVVGTDVVSDLPKWYRADRLIALAPLIVLGRGGHPVDLALVPPGSTLLSGVVLPEVSSTLVRQRLAAGADVSELVPGVVREAMARRGLRFG
ncbi:MAG: hypothetical protein RL199_2501 [Pseudomonadota bacterium]|jgi:nicotinate-nucleotide adenylyltransferase